MLVLRLLYGYPPKKDVNSHNYFTFLLDPHCQLPFVISWNDHRPFTIHLQFLQAKCGFDFINSLIFWSERKNETVFVVRIDGFAYDTGISFPVYFQESATTFQKIRDNSPTCHCESSRSNLLYEAELSYKGRFDCVRYRSLRSAR